MIDRALRARLRVDSGRAPLCMNLNGRRDSLLHDPSKVLLFVRLRIMDPLALVSGFTSALWEMVANKAA